MIDFMTMKPWFGIVGFPPLQVTAICMFKTVHTAMVKTQISTVFTQFTHENGG